jgi:hypothetical protein
MIRKQSLAPSLLASFLVVSSVSLALLHEISHDHRVFGDSNGRLVSFLKSVHSTNYYFFRSRYVSRSLIGGLVLKYFGSTVLSLVLGEAPIWSTSPRHVISFMLAFALVRSDTIEAKELSRHMRHHAAGSFVLNFVAALSKLRKVVWVAEHTNASALGVFLTILLGGVTFSMGNMIMTLENATVDFFGGSATVITPPQLQKSLVRNLLTIGLVVSTHALVASEVVPQMVYFGAKVSCFLYYFYNYNVNVLAAVNGAHAGATEKGPPLLSGAVQLRASQMADPIPHPPEPFELSVGDGKRPPETPVGADAANATASTGAGRSLFEPPRPRDSASKEQPHPWGVREAGGREGLRERTLRSKTREVEK